MKEYSIHFGDFTAMYVKARNADQAIRIAKVLDPEMANKCISRRIAVRAYPVSK